ncbi:tRNA preQ1(34) S-adenosylmethionine ribosyltransferase-isomerase QueA [Desulfobotulus sp.]|jgi:S-adenosylmethionine:tRNA ribosyltransferase-isomerase|uniref:tRNA preQ1(34) S-adenosylmethionine ribosyltransferase-isomerase QueA n=1 Tax=Desulfobotulus sp. TaxID=1940337 RepID=UPI002A372381|nr:tRNA preQ1(34) S-adenosylmethionine ribosyltransferase-isomerase QueA [Desulfobotulus sp.]MDY0162114.1 tRNA preQ1(34) S-adenosylmethionine ribosyltransferase-isomerase QueA [Desulfobotulus sp.]
MFFLSDYAYTLPQELIAAHPAPERDASRLLALNRLSGSMEHRYFRDLPQLLRSGDLLVLNDTRVIPARLQGKKETGGRVEVLILDYVGGCEALEKEGVFRCACLVRASKRPLVGSFLLIGERIRAQVEALEVDGSARLAFYSEDPLPQALLDAGSLPLPPYILRDSEDPKDRGDYQTVYARHAGAVAAPTAGLHFTEGLLRDLADQGVEIRRLTLHVGYGTFAPVRVEDIRTHRMHSERFEISGETAAAICRAKAEGRRVVAVGTTCVRTLEYAGREGRGVTAGKGSCDLFIYPGFDFKIVDAMLTNFHLPETTLMMLVSAFAGYQPIMAAYREAIARRYRFFSYGDAMFIG